MLLWECTSLQRKTLKRVDLGAEGSQWLCDRAKPPEAVHRTEKRLSETESCTKKEHNGWENSIKGAKSTGRRENYSSTTAGTSSGSSSCSPQLSEEVPGQPSHFEIEECVYLPEASARIRV